MIKATKLNILALGLLLSFIWLSTVWGSQQDTCEHTNGWTKIDSDDLSTYPVPGATAYCFKAGSDNSQGCTGGLFTTWPQPEGTCGLSHWSWYGGTLIPTPTVTQEPTATPTGEVWLTLTPTSTPTQGPTQTPTVPTPTTEPSRTTSGQLVDGPPNTGGGGGQNMTLSIVTFYGWPDNSPAGTDIAYPTLHNGAAGTGTYADPITFASRYDNFPVGVRVYVPYLKKYVIKEDLCASCARDQIDIWVNSNGNWDDEVIECEYALTRENVGVIVNPTSSYEVDTRPLFDTRMGQCIVT